VRLDVALLPRQAPAYAGSVCVVVDVLRASSTIVTMLDRGAVEVLTAPTIDAALDLKTRFPDHALCGESGGLPPPGFDYGNSPSEFSQLNLIGRSLILATSNGTRVLAAVAKTAGVALIGALLNRTAAARAALRRAAEHNADITILCSAAHGGSSFVFEDALGAGALTDAACLSDPVLQISDSARFARDAFRQVSSGVNAAIAASYHAQELVAEGLGDDVGYCSRVDVSEAVPLLSRGDDGLLRLRPYFPLPPP
jgi:2-phosphosulfolactate phosphatase